MAQKPTVRPFWCRVPLARGEIYMNVVNLASAHVPTNQDSTRYSGKILYMIDSTNTTGEFDIPKSVRETYSYPDQKRIGVPPT